MRGASGFCWTGPVWWEGSGVFGSRPVVYAGQCLGGGRGSQVGTRAGVRLGGHRGARSESGWSQVGELWSNKV